MSWFGALLLGNSRGARAPAWTRFLGQGRQLVLAWCLLSVSCGRPAMDAPAAPRAGPDPSGQAAAAPPEATSGPEPIREAPTRTAPIEAQPPATSSGDVPATRVSPELSLRASASPSRQEMTHALGPLLSWTKDQGGQVYAALLDLQDNEWLIDQQADQAVNVASNAKVVTAAAALSLLGPDYQFKTELFGSMDQGGRCQRLVLRGGGAPDLSVVDLHRFVSVLKGRGVAQVEHLIVDQSQFSGSYVPPAFEQQPHEWAPFRANISALALDGNVVTLNVFPSQVGQAARVWYEPVGAVAAFGQVLTAATGTGDGVSWQLSAAAGAAPLKSQVGGKLAVDAGRRRYQRRLDDPRLVGGLALRALLEQAGMVVGDVQVGERKREERWAAWSSRPVAELVRKLGKESDNFTAEMLLVALSQADQRSLREHGQEAPWSSERGAQVVDGWLRQLGVWRPGTVVKNGSGLFDANRYSPKLLVELLAHIEDRPELYYDFVSQLAMAATDGTLKQRMQKQVLAGRIRAKTGTLRDVDALTGYIARGGGRSPLAFSLVVFGGRAAHADVRKRMDQAVLAWAALTESAESAAR